MIKLVRDLAPGDRAFNEAEARLIAGIVEERAQGARKLRAKIELISKQLPEETCRLVTRCVVRAWRVVRGRWGSRLGKAKAHDEVFEPRGGETIVDICGTNGVLMARGYALCHDDDNFCKRTGLRIAPARALLNLEWQTVVA